MPRRPPLGQHFLHAEGVADRIVEALAPDGRSVLEIGPGRGVLTGRLAARATRLVAVELDRRLAARLTAHPPSGNLIVHQGDVLSRPLAGWLDLGPGESWLLVGNLPYAITSPVLFAALEAEPSPQRAVLMMQREVAERLVAPPGSRTYGILSVLLQVQAEVELLFQVGRGAFRPPPRVESAVVRLHFLEAPRHGVGGTGGPSLHLFRQVVKAAFGQRRKMLRNSLEALPLQPGEDAGAEAEAAGIDPSRRAETLSGEEFVVLARALAPILTVR